VLDADHIRLFPLTNWPNRLLVLQQLLDEPEELQEQRADAGAAAARSSLLVGAHILSYLVVRWLQEPAVTGPPIVINDVASTR